MEFGESEIFELAEHPVLDALFATVDDESNNLFELVSELITYETGINVEYQPAQVDECRGEPSLLVSFRMPWHFNDKEKNLTKIIT